MPLKGGEWRHPRALKPSSFQPSPPLLPWSSTASKKKENKVLAAPFLHPSFFQRREKIKAAKLGDLPPWMFHLLPPPKYNQGLIQREDISHLKLSLQGS